MLISLDSALACQLGENMFFIHELIENNFCKCLFSFVVFKLSCQKEDSVNFVDLWPKIL